MEENRWEISKIGLVNYWWYDEEEFEFDGEIVLTDPLGVDKRMYEIIKDRVSENL